MSERDALQGFLDKWRAHWPEWAVAETFLPATQRERAQAWLALRGELMDAAWGGDDPTPGAAKLGWWTEELEGWSRGARRHPLGQVLQKLPVEWRALAGGVPALRSSRSPEGDGAATLRGLQPFAHALANASAQLFGAPPVPVSAMAEALLAEWVLHLPERGVPAAGTDVPSLLAKPRLRGGAATERIQAALVRGRLRRTRRGRPSVMPPLVTLFAAWRAARG
ncbi:phytoene/squalene synthase family protein [Thermomonas paludicola]|uniref:phytoene/squalene synthase family protein n=1 Tax=Thermomonas paludicola TaxID=2884874 RepID=UPI00211510D2|nr:phytoene/squalene synthase family protein [Thermomonas paludicola]